MEEDIHHFAGLGGACDGQQNVVNKHVVNTLTFPLSQNNQH